LWRPPECADKCTTHPLAVAEAGRLRHLFDGMGAFFEHHGSDFHAERFDGLCGRLARLLSEGAGELTHAEVCSGSELVHGQLGSKILPREGERCLDSIGLRRHREQR